MDQISTVVVTKKRLLPQIVHCFLLVLVGAPISASGCTHSEVSTSADIQISTASIHGNPQQDWTAIKRNTSSALKRCQNWENNTADLAAPTLTDSHIFLGYDFQPVIGADQNTAAELCQWTEEWNQIVSRKEVESIFLGSNQDIREIYVAYADTLDILIDATKDCPSCFRGVQKQSEHDGIVQSWLQAGAIVKPGLHATQVELIAIITSPYNLKLPVGCETAKNTHIRGAGTAVIALIVKEQSLLHETYGTIFGSIPSEGPIWRDFYQPIGFQIVRNLDMSYAVLEAYFAEQFIVQWNQGGWFSKTPTKPILFE